MFTNRNVIILTLHRIQDFSNMVVSAYLCMLYKDFKTCQNNLYGQGAKSTKCKSIPFFPSIYLIIFHFTYKPQYALPPLLPPLYPHSHPPSTPWGFKSSLKKSTKSTKILQNHQQRDCKFKVSLNYKESSGPVRKQKTLSHKKEK